MSNTATNVLTAADRCDRCAAQAYVRHENKDGLTIDYCAHHDKEHATAMLAQGFIAVIDNTEMLATPNEGVPVV